MYIFISQTDSESLSLSSKVFNEKVHFTFLSFNFSIRSRSNVLDKLEAFSFFLIKVICDRIIENAPTLPLFRCDYGLGLHLVVLYSCGKLKHFL